MAKYCRQCGTLNENPLMKLCREHYYQQELDNPKQLKFKQINKKSKTNKNVPARFTQKTKDEIKTRDLVCIISWDQIEEYHHVFYGPIQTNYTETRNNADQGVWLSVNIHRIIHHPSPDETELSKIYRAKCIEYLLKLK